MFFLLLLWGMLLFLIILVGRFSTIEIATNFKANNGLHRWVGYTKVWNLLDYTALAFPVSTVIANKDTLPSKLYKPRNELDAWNWSLYNPKSMDGHPVGLQVVGRRFEEEKVLGVAKTLEALLK